MNNIISDQLDELKVVKANKLIRAGYKLQKREQIFILYLIAKLDSINHDEFTDFELTFKQVQGIFNFDGKRRVSKRKEVFALIENLNESPIYFEDTEEINYINWLSSVTHFKKTDKFRLRIDPALKSHLLRLKDFFTEYYYKYILFLDLPASFRLYEIFKSYHSGRGVVEKIYEVEDLKFRLGLKGKYHKFYEFKRRVIIPALKEIEKFTDIQASFTIHEKTGKTVTKIKFKVSSNLKNIKKVASPKDFLIVIENIEETEIDLADPIYSNEIYQTMAIHGVLLQEKVKQIIQKCNIDSQYKSYVKDTIERCKKDFDRQPNIENRGGYILDAISKNYFKNKREDEQKDKQKQSHEKGLLLKKQKIEALVKEGKDSFLIRRKPFIRKLRLKYLNDELILSAIQTNKKDVRYHNALADYQRNGKESKTIQRRVDDFLARIHLGEDFVNADSYIEKNFGVKRNGTSYILSN